MLKAECNHEILICVLLPGKRIIMKLIAQIPKTTTTTHTQNYIKKTANISKIGQAPLLKGNFISVYCKPLGQQKKRNKSFFAPIFFFFFFLLCFLIRIFYSEKKYNRYHQSITASQYMRRLILSVRCILSAPKYMTKIKILSAQKPGDCGNKSLCFVCCLRGFQ